MFADGGTFLSVNLHVQVSWFVFVTVYSALGTIIRESPSQFKNRIMAQVYVRSITRSTMYQKAPFC